jgi:hypothetical protein
MLQRFSSGFRACVHIEDPERQLEAYPDIQSSDANTATLLSSQRRFDAAMEL